MKADNIDSDCCHYDTCVVQLMYCSHWLICWNKIEPTNQPNNNFIGDTSSQEIDVNCCGFFYDFFLCRSICWLTELYCQIGMSVKFCRRQIRQCEQCVIPTVNSVVIMITMILHYYLLAFVII